MPKKPGDPIYVSWFVNDGGRKREVNIFQYLSQQIGASTQKWNEFGPGSILFKNGSLKLGNWLTDEAPKNDYTAQVFYLNINTVSAGSTTPEVFAAGMAELFAIVGNPAKIIELERKAYAKMIEHLEVYLSNPGQGRVSAFIMLSQYRDSNKEGEITKESGKIRRRKSWSDTFRPKDRNYTQRWTHLMRNIIMNKNPKVVGGAVLSFSLSDLLSVELSSTNSPLKSIFMMEEFGTGLLADPAYRRPFQSTSATPFKVNPKIANEWDYPEAIYMWFPFFNFLQKARFMMLAKMKRGSSTATRWIKEIRDTHNKKTSLNDYRKKAFASIKKYQQNQSITKNPLKWAYGGNGSIGHPGRQARHLFFDRNGLVQEIRTVQASGYYELLKLIDQEIQKAVPGFPKLADIVFNKPLF